VLLVAALACSGCGTVSNFKDGYKKETRPYGGVRIAAESFGNEDPITVGLLWPALVSDIALSAVGDTVTLPVTASIAVARGVRKGINDYYFPPERGTQTTKWREFWFEHAPPAPSDGTDE
jgi:uncharacterized protein YceK